VEAVALLRDVPDARPRKVISQQGVLFSASMVSILTRLLAGCLGSVSMRTRFFEFIWSHFVASINATGVAEAAKSIADYHRAISQVSTGQCGKKA
jgi:hypothetical protein